MTAYIAYSLFLIALILLLCVIYSRRHTEQRVYYTLRDSVGELDKFFYELREAKIEKRILEATEYYPSKAKYENVTIIRVIEEVVY